MTIQEALQEIISTPKWYIGKYKHSYASLLKRRIFLGKAKVGTVKTFLNTFGYYGSYNDWSNTYQILEYSEWEIKGGNFKELRQYDNGFIFIVLEDKSHKHYPDDSFGFSLIGTLNEQIIPN